MSLINNVLKMIPPYIRIFWLNDNSPDLNQTNLWRMDNGIYEATEAIRALEQSFVPIPDILSDHEARITDNTSEIDALIAKAYAGMNLLPPSINFADISAKYPSPTKNDAVQTINDGKVYQYNGTSWIYKLTFAQTYVAESGSLRINNQDNSTVKKLSFFVKNGHLCWTDQ